MVAPLFFRAANASDEELRCPIRSDPVLSRAAVRGLLETSRDRPPGAD